MKEGVSPWPTDRSCSASMLAYFPLSLERFARRDAISCGRQALKIRHQEPRQHA